MLGDLAENEEGSLKEENANAYFNRLKISVVVYNTDFQSIIKLSENITRCVETLPIKTKIIIIDNSQDGIVKAKHLIGKPNVTFEVIHGQGNVGFGRGHNLAMNKEDRYHLILNPDVVLDIAAISNALNFLELNKSCGLLSPYAIWPNGERQYLCKRYPRALDLFLRGFAPKFVNNLFEARLADYELRNETEKEVYWDPPIVSGCFMFFRGSVLHDLEGFDPAYFLYFEDFDLSWRASKHSRIVYFSNVKIVHEGGRASRKGLVHIIRFIRSGIRFYIKHGFRLV